MTFYFHKNHFSEFDLVIEYNLESLKANVILNAKAIFGDWHS